jgi:hypothetical protein
MKKILLFSVALLSYSVSFADVMTITIHGFQGPRDNPKPTTSPAPGGTTYTIDCYPSGGTCTTFTVIVPNKLNSNAYIGSFGELRVFSEDGGSTAVRGYCKDLAVAENQLTITLDSLGE